MRLLTLPEILRGAGLTVHEVDGWRKRGGAGWGPIRGITCHHTGGSVNATDNAEIAVLLHGSTTAPPPISQLYLSRTGAWSVVASGMCYHNLIGWGGPNIGLGNASLIGIEAAHRGPEPWSTEQYHSYVIGTAALCRALNVPVARVAGHKEHQPGDKIDPMFDMDNFRHAVATLLSGGSEMLTQEDGKIIVDAIGTVVPWRSDTIAKAAMSRKWSPVSIRGIAEYSLSYLWSLVDSMAVVRKDVADIKAAQVAQNALIRDLATHYAAGGITAEGVARALLSMASQGASAQGGPTT